MASDLRERARAAVKAHKRRLHHRNTYYLDEELEITLADFAATIRAEAKSVPTWDDAVTWLRENGGPYEHHAARLLAANKPQRKG